MKINEKNLCLFATTPPSDLEGYLNKRGEVNKSWQRRWFVLKGNLLFYFEKKGDKEPIGVIVLEGCTIELAEDGENYCFQIVFHGINNRTYYLCAENQEVMEKWMKALTCAGYEYMKLMVAELQRQLGELDEKNTESEAQATSVTPKPPPRRQNPFNRVAPPVPSPTTQSRACHASPESSSAEASSGYHQNSTQSTENDGFFKSFHEELGKTFVQEKNRRKTEEVIIKTDPPPLIDL
ncbi:sesquipedalian-1-like isoform X2 [Phlebotomus argentipes]|uniref:sesquipedalian-1-like isoform X2 n=1 Tax=Phlebotomus argentipes TaxID=94469 RepID=UPI002892F8A1|nr:sesquipedalian-1-like isoform X2 [Phlebotomus argentipes]